MVAIVQPWVSWLRYNSSCFLRQNLSLAWISTNRLGWLDLHVLSLPSHCWDNRQAILSFPSFLPMWVLDVKTRSLYFRVKYFTDGAVSLWPALLNMAVSPFGGATCFTGLLEWGQHPESCLLNFQPSQSLLAMCVWRMAVIKGYVESIASIEWDTIICIYRFHHVKTNHFQWHQVTKASVKISIVVQSTRQHSRTFLSNMPSLFYVPHHKK